LTSTFFYKDYWEEEHKAIEGKVEKEEIEPSMMTGEQRKIFELK